MRMSDDQIAKAIEHHGDLILSRKTIENYRKELEIPSARAREFAQNTHEKGLSSC